MASFPGRGHVYDLAVVGAGISGSEAALAAAAGGLDVLLVTTSLDSLYMLAHASYPLEPPPGTLMARLLPELAGPGGAVDRWELHRAAKYRLEAQPGVHLLQSNVTGLITEEGSVTGVRTWEGVPRLARHTLLCVGSFLRARLEQGRLQEVSGRLGEMSYDELAHDLQAQGVRFERSRLTLDDRAEGPPYTVTFDRLAGSELGEHGRLRRFEGLLACGSCVRQLGYEEAAAEGLELGGSLPGLLRAAPPQ